jgi:desulfoferrodoxin (superoxide reductase-like protein)
MKKYLILFLFLFIAGIFYGTSPSDIVFTYSYNQIDISKSVLTVEVKHPIANTPLPDPAKHYIQMIELHVNGYDVETQTFTKQESMNGQTAKFTVYISATDVVSVTATCSIRGSLTEEFTIPPNDTN